MYKVKEKDIGRVIKSVYTISALSEFDYTMRQNWNEINNPVKLQKKKV